MEEDIFAAHSMKQERALFAQKRILLLGTGTQWGKTSVGAVRMKWKICEYPGPNNNFIITSPSYPTMAQSTLPPFLRVMQGYGTHDKKDNCFKLHRGGTVWLRTETDQDSIVGITNVRHIWCDEAGKYRLYFWENIQARADFFGCQVDLTTSPYALNWIYKDLIKPTQAGLRDDVDLISASSWENPYHSLHDPDPKIQAQKIEDKLSTMDERRFKAIYGGSWEKMEGLVYDCWDDVENTIAPFALPPGTRYFAGIDWGYNPDPFALVIRGITPDGRHYGVSEFVKTKMTINDIIPLVRAKKYQYNIETFYCDPSQPASIEELNRNGCTAVGAKNDIRQGLDAHYELIKTRKYKHFTGAMAFTKDELETYHYPEPKDLKPDQNSKELLPVDQGNHCLDAERYVTVMTYRTGHIRLTPHVNDGTRVKKETITDKLARLKRKKNYSQTENWG